MRKPCKHYSFTRSLNDGPLSASTHPLKPQTMASLRTTTLKVIMLGLMALGMMCTKNRLSEHLNNPPPTPPEKLHIHERTDLDRDSFNPPAPTQSVDKQKSLSSYHPLATNEASRAGTPLPLNEDIFKDPAYRRVFTLLQQKDRDSCSKALNLAKRLGEEPAIMAEILFAYGQAYMFADDLSRPEKNPAALYWFGQALRYDPLHRKTHWQRRVIQSIYRILKMDPEKKELEYANKMINEQKKDEDSP